MEPDVSLQHLQMPDICPYLEPDRSSLCLPIALPKTHLNIILTSRPGSSKWSPSLSFPHQNPVHISAFRQYVLNVPPISSSPIWSTEIHSDLKIMKLYVHPITCWGYLNYRQYNKSQPKNILLAPKPRGRLQKFKSSNEGLRSHNSHIATIFEVDLQVPHTLNFKRRIKSHLTFAGIIRSSPYSPCCQDKG